MISIIMPCYNAERFIEQILDSIIAQSYVAWELICVNDGSNDSTLEILHRYAKLDERIVVVDKKNEGVSMARNTALNLARGRYVYFVDADDVVCPNSLKVLVETMEAACATLVKGDYVPIDVYNNRTFVNKKQVIRIKHAGIIMPPSRFYEKIMMREYFLWTCLFRRDIIEEHHIRFIPHCRLMEDAAFMAAYLVHSPRNVYVDECVYGYRKYENTASAVKRDYSADLMMIQGFLATLPRKKFVMRMENEIRLVLIDYKGTWFQRTNKGLLDRMNKIIVYIQYFLSR